VLTKAQTFAARSELVDSVIPRPFDELSVIRVSDSSIVRAASRPPAKIAILDHTAALGGGEIALLNFVRLLDRSRYDPVVILFSDGPLRDRLTNARVRSVLIPLNANVVNARKDTLGARTLVKIPQLISALDFSLRLLSYLRSERFALIHTNSLKSDILGGIAGKIARVPVIWHVRDRIDTDYLPKSVVAAFRLLAKFLPTCVIANSAATLETLHLPANRFRATVPSGISLGPSRRVVHDGTHSNMGDQNPDRRAGQTPVIGIVGRLSPWKGQHIFIKAASEVLKRFPQCRFQIVGSALFGEDHYEKGIFQLINRLGITNSVELLGFRTDVAQLMANFRILVHASTSGEPFGQVIVEGMALGKPIVATNGGGVPEIVVDGVTGILVPMGNAGAMARAICRLLEDEQLGHRMGIAGSQRVREFFDIEQTVKKIEKIYDSLLLGGTNHSVKL
jgi:glycosyltransferase involved in cell wall biosynthesis